MPERVAEIQEVFDEGVKLKVFWAKTLTCAHLTCASKPGRLMKSSQRSTVVSSTPIQAQRMITSRVRVNCGLDEVKCLEFKRQNVTFLKKMKRLSVNDHWSEFQCLSVCVGANVDLSLPVLLREKIMQGAQKWSINPRLLNECVFTRERVCSHVKSVRVCVCLSLWPDKRSSELWEMSGNSVRMECQGYRGYRGILPVHPPSGHTHTYARTHPQRQFRGTSGSLLQGQEEMSK